jgi:hypothetical protein
VAAAFSAVSLLLNCLLLEETLPSIVAAWENKQQQRQQDGYSAVTSTPSLPVAGSIGANSSSNGKSGLGSRLAALRSRMVAATAAVMPQEREQQQQQRRGQYRRLLSSSGSSKMGLQAGSSSSVAVEHSSSHPVSATERIHAAPPAATADTTAASAKSSSGDAECADDDPGPFLLCQAEQGLLLQPTDSFINHSSTDGSNSSNMLIQQQQGLRDAERKSSQLQQPDQRLLQPTDSFICTGGSSSSSSASKDIHQQQQQQQQGSLPHAESASTIQLASASGRQLDLRSSSSSSMGGSKSLLRWDSVWLLRSFNSSFSRTDNTTYTKLEQQQQQEVVLELAPLQSEDTALQREGERFASFATRQAMAGDDHQQQDQEQQQQQHDDNRATQPEQQLPSPKHTQQQQQQQQQQQHATPWYRQRQVLLALAGYGNTCLLFCALDELTPMFASAPLAQGELGCCCPRYWLQLIKLSAWLLFCALDELPPVFASAPLAQGELCCLPGRVLAGTSQGLSMHALCVRTR